MKRAIRASRLLAAVVFLGAGWAGAADSLRASVFTTSKTFVVLAPTRATRAIGNPLPSPGDLFAAPAGTAANPGTQDKPTTLDRAINSIGAGRTIWVRGGIYKFATTLTIRHENDGTSTALKTLRAFQGEVPVLDFSAQGNNGERGLTLNGAF